MRTLLPAPPEAGTASRLRRAATVGVALLAVVVVIGAIALIGMRLARDGALPGTSVDDLDVGGADEAGLHAFLRDHADRRERRQVTVSLADVRVSGAAADAGYRFDVEATAAAVLRRGRQTNPLAALVDQLRAIGGAIPVEPVEDVDPELLDTWVTDAAADLSQFPVEGSLAFAGAQVTRVDPRPGVVVSAEPLEGQLRRALLDQSGDIAVAAEDRPVAPETTAADVDAVLADAQQALSAPVTLTRNGGAVTLAPDDIGGVLVVAQDGGDLHLDVDAARLTAAIGPEAVEAFEADPRDATFTVSGGTVTVHGSQEGFRFDPAAAAAQVRTLLTAEGPREAQLDGEVVAPALSTAEAEALRIDERVSTFTTHFTAGQSRVTNIRRIAELVDGVVLRPGETFSVNDHVGERTAAKGFVGGGAISAGEFVEQIGGGVSQFATTMYNAAYFGGYAIPQYKAHSYYISRYPVGREATLNYPDVDLRIQNSSPHGALVKTASTATSVTVSFYGTRWVDVESITGERTDIRPPEVQVRVTDDLPPGQERVVQEGREGFDIVVTRVLTYPDGRVEREPDRTRYLPEPRIVERGASPAAPAPASDPEPAPAPPAPQPE